MRRFIIIISLSLSALLILDSMDAAHALMMFIIAGQIPGTTLYVDAGSMLALFAGVFGFITGRMTIRLVSLAQPVLTRRRA